MIRKTSAEEVSGLEWFKSSYSDSSNGSECVEVAPTSRGVHVRDSKFVQGSQVHVSVAAWAAFVGHASGRR
ncbi:DUF397 domain-containing protein [Streptomyces sp. CA-294286]|uniref:DUF397 domain-containing protein n=1 Tax=Streptomyces sp. CA-294286 TaxID=3240070 RepID=UPI003D8D0716